MHVFRETAARYQRPVMLYSTGKGSSVMLRLAQKAFHPEPIPFPLLHVDTGYEFREMISFRDTYPKSIGARLLVYKNQEAIARGASPLATGTQRCCALLKMKALLDALRAGSYDVAFGGARPGDDRARIQEPTYSYRDGHSQGDIQFPGTGLRSVQDSRSGPGETDRVFPLADWTEIDVWQYIHIENIPIVPLYFAADRPVLVRDGALLLPEQDFITPGPGEHIETVRCRMRSLGCSPCTGAIRSEAVTVPEIIEELVALRRLEREDRADDGHQDGSMEGKRREG